MRLKKIVLSNIRSYKKETIEFPKGITLLSGDIGSGKTSILLGIEFALFGLQPGQRGASILRNGEVYGGVIIEFEVDDKEVIIERTLKRAKAISQDYCSISIDGEKSEISVMELKNKVLDLLKYPTEFSKKQNILYKFTVYTPQEEMKQIILQDPGTRLNTLRHVFGIDKYKRILENVSIITAKIREEKRVKEGLTADLEKDKENLASKEDELESKQYNLVSVEKELFLKTEARKKIQEEQEEITKKIEEKTKFQQEIEKTKIRLLDKEEAIISNERTIDQLKSQIKEIEAFRFDESEISRLEQKKEQAKKEKEILHGKQLDITAQITALDFKNQENESTKNKISKIDLCPTCLQDVEPVYKSNVVNKLDSEISQNVRTMKDLNLEKAQISEKITKLSNEINSLEKETQELRILKVKVQTSTEKKQRCREIERMTLALKKDSEFLNSHIKDLQNSVFELTRFDQVFESKKVEFKEALKEERTAEIKKVELKKEIEVFSSYISEIKVRIEKIREIRQQLSYLVKLEDWLSKKFVPLMSFIEKNVMVKLQAEFSQLFSEWFGMLVSDSFNVRLRDDFTPIIENQDYEIEYAYLSGGERTAVALAYRLALNQVINSLLSQIKTKDLVILDEPTDGFSEQQLDKMRDVLHQLNVGQMIIVSHEQRIEGFVENLIRFQKKDGVSSIEE